MNFVAGILIVIAFTFIGFGYDNYCIARLNIIKDFSNFIDFSIAEIAYLKTDLLSLITKYDNLQSSTLSKALLTVKNPTLLYVDDLKLSLLTASEKQLIVLFIKDISRLDTDGQRAFANEYKLRVNTQIQYMQDKQLTKGKLFKKLAPLLGLGIMIIII